MKLRNLLAIRGIHYLASRFGSPRLRSLAFDAKYASHKWKFDADEDPQLASIIQPRLRGGGLLLMGCGSAGIVSGLTTLSPDERILGIDLSPEAIRLANRHQSDRVSFQVGDFLSFETSERFDAIVFSESLNYLSVHDAARCLHRLEGNLNPNGTFIVTLAQPDRYRSLLTMIRGSFDVQDDRPFASSVRHLVVFEPRASATRPAGAAAD